MLPLFLRAAQNYPENLRNLAYLYRCGWGNSIAKTGSNFLIWERQNFLDGFLGLDHDIIITFHPIQLVYTPYRMYSSSYPLLLNLGEQGGTEISKSIFMGDHSFLDFIGRSYH